MKVTEALNERGIEFQTIHLDQSVHTAQDVARTCNCSISEVLKSLVFICDGSPLVAVVPGDVKVDFIKLAHAVNKRKIRFANKEEVIALTSYETGTVSPIGLDQTIQKTMDKKVLQLDQVFVGSGLRDVVLRLHSSALKQIWDGTITDISTS